MTEPTAQQGGVAPAPEGTQGAEPSKPDFLDPRFNSIEEQAKAYKEAEKKMQQEASKRAELERQNQELLSRQQAAPVAPQEPQVDLNELYWQKPAEVMERLVAKHVEPFYEDKYEAQKQLLLSKDANYAKYFPQIDAMVKAQPALKKQPGIVEKLYKVASAMEFDPAAERKRIEDQIRAEMQGKVITSVEGGGAAPAGTPTNTTELTQEQKQFAERFHKDLPPLEAHKKYAANLQKWQGGA